MPTCTRKTHKCPKSTRSIRAHRASPTAPDAARQATELPTAPIERFSRAAPPVDSAHARGLDRAIPVRHRPVTACANGDATARRRRAAARARAAGEGRGNRSGRVVGSSVPMGGLSWAGGGAHRLGLRRQDGGARHLHAPKCTRDETVEILALPEPAIVSHGPTAHGPARWAGQAMPAKAGT